MEPLIKQLSKLRSYAARLHAGNPKRFYAFSGIAVLMVVFIGSSLAIGLSHPKKTTALLQESQRSRYRTVQAELLSDTSLLIPGTVLSNETANIYPRRSGIVEDIYVDIGDRVQKGDVVALLLSQGVEGQSSAKIAEKSAMKALAETDHLNAQSVAAETVNNAYQMIEEKQIALEVAKREQEGLLRKIEQSAESVVQMREQAYVTVRDARQVVERILTGDNASTGINVRESDILPELGILQSNREGRYYIVGIFNAFRNLEYSYLRDPAFQKGDTLEAMFAKAHESFIALHDLLAATGTIPIAQPGRGTKRDPVDITKEIHTIQGKVLKAEEKWQDAILSYQELIASEPELVKALAGELSSAQSNKVKLLSSQLKTSQDNLHLIESQQKQMIDRSEQTVNIADASLRSESAQSGHHQIRSPFTGIISKRFIDVGEVVSLSHSAFELVDVPTSLAKEAKTEIKFGLPEHLQSSVDIDSVVTFLLPGDDERSYEAIVTRKSPQVDMETHTITVQAKLADDLSLPHHSSVRVRIDEYGEPVFRIPSYAAKRIDTGNIIWVLDTATGEPVQKSVTVISEDGEFAEVSGAIDAETLIILDPPDLFQAKESDQPSVPTP